MDLDFSREMEEGKLEKVLEEKEAGNNSPKWGRGCLVKAVL